MQRSTASRLTSVGVALGGLVLGLVGGGPRDSALAAGADAERLRAPQRPLTSAVVAFDYGALPLAPKVGWATCSNTTPTISGWDRGPMSTTQSSWTLDYRGEDAIIRLGGAQVRDGQYFGGRDPFDASRGPGTAVSPLESWWVHLERSSATDAVAHVSECNRSGRAGAITQREVNAIALVPGKLYAYRTCDTGCGGAPDAPERKETLHVVTSSSAVWVASSGWSSVRTDLSLHETISYADAPVEADSTATIVVELMRDVSTGHSCGSAAQPLDVFQIEVTRGGTGSLEGRIFHGERAITTPCR